MIIQPVIKWTDDSRDTYIRLFIEQTYNRNSVFIEETEDNRVKALMDKGGFRPVHLANAISAFKNAVTKRRERTIEIINELDDLTPEQKKHPMVKQMPYYIDECRQNLDNLETVVRMLEAIWEDYVRKAIPWEPLLPDEADVVDVALMPRKVKD
jgi:hypothetical protein